MESHDSNNASPMRKPAWLRVKLPQGEQYVQLKRIIDENRLHTVCQSASCPNVGECWAAGVATLMIMGGVCTRDCRFCDVPTGQPGPADVHEPQRVAEAARLMNLHHLVITCVTRDDLPDGGAGLWAETVRAVRRESPKTKIEVLPSDFGGSRSACQTLIDARPDVFGHNLETVPDLYPAVRPGADYARSLAVLRWAAEADLVVKSGLMVGLGEDFGQIQRVLRDLRQAGARIVTIGQYLRPSRRHLPVQRYVTPEEFAQLQKMAEDMGFESAACGPLVRSSYHADQHAARLAGRAE